MVLESAVAIMLTFLVAYLYLRSGKRAMFIAILPLTIVPAANILGFLLSKSISSLLHFGETNWRLIFIALGLAVSVAIVGSISTKLKRRASRRWYLLVCVGYCLIFSCIIMVKVIGY